MYMLTTIRRRIGLFRFFNWAVDLAAVSTLVFYSGELKIAREK